MEVTLIRPIWSISFKLPFFTQPCFVISDYKRPTVLSQVSPSILLFTFDKESLFIIALNKAKGSQWRQHLVIKPYEWTEACAKYLIHIEYQESLCLTTYRVDQIVFVLATSLFSVSSCRVSRCNDWSYSISSQPYDHQMLLHWEKKKLWYFSTMTSSSTLEAWSFQEIGFLFDSIELMQFILQALKSRFLIEFSWEFLKAVEVSKNHVVNITKCSRDAMVDYHFFTGNVITIIQVFNFTVKSS